MQIVLILIALVVLVLFVILIGRTQGTGKKALLILALVVLVLFIAFRFLIPMQASPAPRGEKSVQTDTVYYRHASAYPEMHTGNNEREIPVHVWYPEGAKEQEHPLLLFSHGAFGVGFSNETLFLELASRGYIVFSLDHPHHSFKSTLSDGETVYADRTFIQSVMANPGDKDLATNWDDLRSWSLIRMEDLSFVLDKLLDAEADNRYEGCIDTERIVVSGHSLGGSAALGMGRLKPADINAVVVLEAPFAQDITGIAGDEYVFTEEAYPLPLLHVYSDALYGKWGDIATYAMNERLYESDDPKYVTEHIAGVGHMGLTDMSLLSPILTNWVDGGLNTRKAPETLLELNGIVLAFLEIYNP